MTTVATIFALTVAVLLAALAYARNRANNLDYLWQRERAEHLETLYKLEDATRTVARLQTSNSALIEEATTLGWDLAVTEREAAYYRSHFQHRKGMVAGFRLTHALSHSNRVMELFDKELAP